MEKLRTARKEYACGYCREPIAPGSKYVEIKKRYPVYSENLNQDGPTHQNGVYYSTLRVHSKQYSDCLFGELEHA